MSKPNSLQWALYYLTKLHYSVIPCGHDKKPLIKWEQYQRQLASEQQVKQWWQEHPDANVGIVTGLVSGIAVIDVDTDEGKEAIQQYLPDSFTAPTVQTPKGGQHLYCKLVDPRIRNNARAIPGCDLRAEGGYVLAPPSTNGVGKAYRWNLYIITSGFTPTNPAELLGSMLMRRWMEEFRNSPHLDVVIFDSPPVLAVADSAVLAASLEAKVLLVTHAGQTRRSVAAKAKERFSSIKVDIVGVVLNNADLRDEDYYGYNYSYYYTSNPNPTTEQANKS